MVSASLIAEITLDLQRRARIETVTIRWHPLRQFFDVCVIELMLVLLEKGRHKGSHIVFHEDMLGHWFAGVLACLIPMALRNWIKPLRIKQPITIYSSGIPIEKAIMVPWCHYPITLGLMHDSQEVHEFSGT